ncbi:TIR domain-containing protein [Kribbella sp. NPDC051952]|uniref:TIR domain-containing protein n=1 Tax=Kribbella sp. NPDC051952 TaxID=3154851 RepID=UPI003431B634
MGYRNKTYVAFASEDIDHYYMMKAWRANKNIEFDFYNAHDLYPARDASLDESIKAQLRERMKNAKQFVLLGSSSGKKKGGNGTSFLAYEVKTMVNLGLPVVVANIEGNRRREIDRSLIPTPLLDADYYTLSVSFQPAIIKFALDKYAPQFVGSKKTGPHYYESDIYEKLGL